MSQRKQNNAQKWKMLQLLQQGVVSVGLAKDKGVNNPRQQVAFLRIHGYIIDNYKPKHYKLIL